MEVAFISRFDNRKPKQPDELVNEKIRFKEVLVIDQNGDQLIGQKNFGKRITTWVKIADLHGIDALKHPTTCTEYTVEERYALVARVLAGESQKKCCNKC